MGQTLEQRIEIERIRAAQDERRYARRLRGATLRGENMTRGLCAPCPDPVPERPGYTEGEFVLSEVRSNETGSASG